MAQLDGSARVENYDVVIIGGGINGASACQRLASQGYRVLLVEKDDFGAGSSGRSSRFLHCGLRYLAPGRSLWDFVRHPRRLISALRMARQSMVARHDLAKTTPGGLQQIRFAYPIYRTQGYRGWQVDMAFRLLWLIGPKGVPLDYCRLSRDEACRIPLLAALGESEALDSVATYREYQFDWPERFCIDCVLDARRMGAHIRNYTIAALEVHDGDRWTVRLIEEGRNYSRAVRTKVVLNTAGIWIDDVNARVGYKGQRFVFGTKGAHIVLRLPKQFAGLGIATLNSKKEPFYLVPWHGLHFFGPTETVYEDDKDNIRVTEADQDWLLAEANRMLPELALSRDDVLMTWAGVRPLTHDPAVPFGKRDRIIHDQGQSGMPGVIAMTGGPVQGHRSAGEELAAAVAGHIAAQGPRQIPDFATPDRARYARFLDGTMPEDDIVLIREAVENEMAKTAMDILLRRTGLLWKRVPTAELMDRFATAYGAATGKDARTVAEELAQFRTEYNRLFGPRGAMSAQTNYEPAIRMPALQ